MILLLLLQMLLLMLLLTGGNIDDSADGCTGVCVCMRGSSCRSLSVRVCVYVCCVHAMTQQRHETQRDWA